GASNMWNSVLEDSSIVQEWLARAKQEGTLAHARAMLLRQGTAKFGPPDAASAAHIESSDIDQLDQLSLRLLTANSWTELLC
ncbi:MAG TPA: hypothetical protein VGV35_16355, partial [Bryobacteraceae bacterium]|nr:hypothetical protein [Bryobacteraceae bacterium]